MNKYEFKGTNDKWGVEPCGSGLDVWAGNVCIATVETVDIRHKHNAHLIASAPELLEACMEALKELETRE